MRLIFAAVFILCIIMPFVNGSIDIPEISGNISGAADAAYASQEKTSDYFTRSVERNISRSVGEYLSENDISFSEIKTSINISDSGRISINEIEIAVPPAAREDEIIELVKIKTSEDTTVKIKEQSPYEYEGTD